MKNRDLFDGEESESRKKKGMAVGAANNYADLETGRMLARRHPDARTGITADDVGRALKARGITQSLGPAAGSLFAGKDWQWTGEFLKSKRITNHSRLLRVWRYVGTPSNRDRFPPLASVDDYRRASQGE